MKVLLIIFLGASIGSFLGLVIDRFPERSIVTPSSHCNRCQKRLRWWEMIPILSQIFLKFKCRRCGGRIPYWYCLVEGLTALFLLLYIYQLVSVMQLLLLISGLVLAIYDIKHQAYPFMVWCVLTTICLLFSQLNWSFVIFLLLAYLTERWSLKIGSGDFLYLASLSLLFNPSQILWIIHISSILGILIFSFYKGRSLPYIPFLYLASITVQIIFL